MRYRARIPLTRPSGTGTLFLSLVYVACCSYLYLKRSHISHPIWVCYLGWASCGSLRNLFTIRRTRWTKTGYRLIMLFEKLTRPVFFFSLAFYLVFPHYKVLAYSRGS